MYQNETFGTTGVQVSKLPIGVLKIDGAFLGNANAFLQVHDSCTAPAAAAVPMRQEPLNAQAPFYFEFKTGEIRTTEGLWVGVSSTDGTYTASALTMDITVETDIKPTTLTTVGDKTTTLNHKQIWSQATGAAAVKLLYCLIITEQLGAARYIIIYCDDAAAGKQFNVYPLAANGTVKLYFGDNGVQPYTVASTYANYATETAVPSGLQYGCTVYVDDAVPANGGANVTTANSAVILALTN